MAGRGGAALSACAINNAFGEAHDVVGMFGDHSRRDKAKKSTSDMSRADNSATPVQDQQGSPLRGAASHPVAAADDATDPGSPNGANGAVKRSDSADSADPVGPTRSMKLRAELPRMLRVGRSFSQGGSQDFGDSKRGSTVSTSASFCASSDSDAFFYSEKVKIRRFMSSPPFDCAIGFVILSNCIAIGFEQTWDLEGRDSSVLKTLEHVYLCIYLIELLLRFFAWGVRCLEDNWVKFDLCLVVVGVGTGWIVQPLMGTIEKLGPFMVLRTARLMRLARTVRLLIKFRELWMLVRGLLNSASTMVYTLLMLVVVIYICACMSMEIVTNHEMARPGPSYDPEFAEFVTENFGTLPVTMMSLIQFATMDNMNLLYMPLIKKSWWLGCFFISIILVISIVLMNLITAVVVNSALEQAMSDKEAMKAHQNSRRKKLMKDLKRMFMKLDDDNSGQVSAEEMQMMGEEDKSILADVLGISEPMEIFKQLDVDGSGSLEIDEFCDGIWQVAISKAPIELKRIEKQVNSLKMNVLELRSGQSAMQEILDTVLSALNANLGQSRANTKDSVQVPIQDSGEVNPKVQETNCSSTVAGPVSSSALGLDSYPNKGIEIGLAGMRDSVKDSLSAEVEELSSQLQQVLRKLQSEDAKEVIVSLGDRSGQEPSYADPMPKWVAALRAELFESTQSMTSSREQCIAQGSLEQFGSAGKHFALGDPAPTASVMQPPWAEELKQLVLSETRGVRETVQLNLREVQKISVHLDLERGRSAPKSSTGAASPNDTTAPN